MENIIQTGMIMDGITQTQEQKEAKNNIDTAIGFNQEKMIAQMAKYQARHTTYKREYKIGRNDPCPCGSGKKYKNCCLASGKYEKIIKT